jgi:hypothetical protein
VLAAFTGFQVASQTKIISHSRSAYGGAAERLSFNVSFDEVKSAKISAAEYEITSVILW